MRSTLADLQSQLTGATMSADIAFDGVSTDSRAVQPGNLFVALRGEHFDAHDFLPEVAAKGAVAIVAERIPAGGLPVPVLTVPDTRLALGEIARVWRQRFTLPVIGVTGSNGKTTVKEMIAAILAAAFGADAYLATRGNLNNEIGVPLTLFRLDADDKAAVVELGMNHPGEIAVLTAIARPTVGLVNNAQREHQEFMESVEAVARENGAVIAGLPENGTAVFPADDPYSTLWRGFAEASGQRRILTFGLSSDADVTCTFQVNDFGSDLSISANGKIFQVKLLAAGEHNVRNALAATACAMAIGISEEIIARGLESFVPVNGRLQRKVAHNGAAVIDDTYNANPDSVRAAIDVLAGAPSPRVLVLGDMGEVGSEGRRFHEEVGAYAQERGIEQLLTIGQLAYYTAGAYDTASEHGPSARHFNDIETLNQAVEAIVNPDTTVLVKGSRFMKMERVVHYLTNQKTLGTTQEIH